MQSRGGKGVLSCLQGVLRTLGLLIPPLTGLVYSAADQAAIAASGKRLGRGLGPATDVHATLAHDLLAALYRGNNCKAWPVERSHFGSRWIEPITVTPAVRWKVGLGSSDKTPSADSMRPSLERPLQHERRFDVPC